MGLDFGNRLLSLLIVCCVCNLFSSLVGSAFEWCSVEESFLALCVTNSHTHTIQEGLKHALYSSGSKAVNTASGKYKEERDIMLAETLGRLRLVDSSVWSRFLSVSSLVLGVVALFSSVYADVFFCVDRPLSHAGILGALGCTALGGLSAMLAGVAQHGSSGYQLWQPFRGGLAFTILQYFGWLFYGVSVTMFSVFVASFEKFCDCRGGTIAAVGCLAFAAVLTLLASLPRFESNAPPLFAHLKLIKTDNLVVVACLAASMTFALLIESDAALLRPYRAGLTASLFAVGLVAVVLVLFLGRRRYQGKKIFHPFQGGFYFVLMQSSGWAGVAVAMFFFLRFAVDHMFPGMLVGVTFLHTSSVWLLLLSLDCFDDSNNLILLARFKFSREIIAALMIGLMALVTIAVCDLATVQSSFLYYFALLCQALVPPTIHVYASVALRQYALWQPFRGGSRFIVLQGIAWALYAIAHMVILLALWNHIYALVAAGSLFIFITGSLLCVSLHLFEANDPLDPAADGMPSSATARHRSASYSPYLNGELVTSSLMSIGGLMTMVVSDTSTQRVFQRAHICIFGVVSMLIAPILAHLSGRKVHPFYRALRPFYGGPDHVALQTVGWTLWGVTVVTFAILEVNLFLSDASVPRGAASLAALISLFSYSLVVASIPLFQPTALGHRQGPLDDDGGQDGSAPAAAVRETTAMGGVQLRLVGLRRTTQPGMDATVGSPELENKWTVAAAEAQRLLSSGAVHSEELASVLRCLIAAATPAATGDRGNATEGRPSTVSPSVAQREEGGMGFLAVTLSSGSLVLGTVNELLFFVLREPQRTAAAAPIAIAMFLSCVGACAITHLVSGTRRYPNAFHWWMPFGGGSNFALLQTIGWALVSIHLSLFFSSLYYLYDCGNLSLFTGTFFATGFFAFAGHMFLIVSLSQFDVDAELRDYRSKSFLHRHSEWFLGSILSVVFVAATTVVEVQWRERGVLPRATVPVLFGGGFACIGAVALGWTSVYKTARREETPTSDAEHSSTTSSSSSSSSSIAIVSPYHLTYITETVVGLVALFWLLQALVPASVNGWIIAIAMGALLHHMAMLLAIVWREHRSVGVVLLELRAEFATFALYSFHYVVMGFLVYVGFFLRISTASVIFFVMVNTLSFGTPSVTRFIQAAAVVCVAFDVVTLSCDYVLFMGPLLLYTTTYLGSSQVDGSRSVRKQLSPYLQWFWNAIARYFSLRIHSELKDHRHDRPSSSPTARLSEQAAAARQKKILFGFHPHGVCPYTCIWATLCSLWSQGHQLPIPAVHVSSFLMAVPIVRDVLLALGVVDCTVEALQRSFRDDEVSAALIVPGGQREYAQPLPSSEGVSLITKNKGLFRFALTHGAVLVPIFCFGETDVMNGAPLPSFQLWARFKLGVTYPQLPHGRLLLPLPRRVPLYLAVGSGIDVDPITDPKPSDIDGLHARYYDVVTSLFDRHKAAAGYPNAVLTLVA